MAQDDTKIGPFIVSTIFFLLGGVLLLGLFEYCRRRKVNFALYQPRCNAMVSFAIKGQRRDFPSPPEPNLYLFGWYKSSKEYYTTDEEMVELLGLDAVMYLKFFDLLAWIVLPSTIFSYCVLLPIYCAKSNNVSGMSTTSISNIDNNSSSAVAPLFGIYLLTFWTLYLLNKSFKRFQVLRQYHFRKAQSRGDAMSIFLIDIPTAFRSDIKLYEKFVELYGNAVSHAVVTKKCSTISNLVKLRTAFVEGYEEAVFYYRERRSFVTSSGREDLVEAETTRPTLLLQSNGTPVYCRAFSSCFAGTTRVDALRYYLSHIQESNDAIAAALSEEPKYCSTGFVCFNDPVVAMSATVCPASTALKKSSLAREDRDVIWSNAEISQLERYARNRTGTILYVALFIFWVIPVAFVASLVTFQSIGDELNINPNFTFVVDGFFTGVLPALTLFLFKEILPDITTAITCYQGVCFWLDVDNINLEKLFPFDCIHYYLVILLAGTFLNEISAFLNDTSNFADAINRVAQSFTDFGSFFTQFVMLMSFFVPPLHLLRIDKYIAWGVKAQLASSERMRNQYARRARTLAGDYGEYYSRYLLVFLIVISFANIFPLITLPGLLGFAYTKIISKYNAVYMILPKYEGGGCIFHRVYNRLIICLVISQVTMFSILLLKKCFLPAFCTIPLPFITFASERVMFHAYSVISKLMTVEQAVFSRENTARPPAPDCYVREEWTSAILNNYLPLTQVDDDPPPPDYIYATPMGPAVSDDRHPCHVRRVVTEEGLDEDEEKETSVFLLMPAMPATSAVGPAA